MPAVSIAYVCVGRLSLVDELRNCRLEGINTEIAPAIELNLALSIIRIGNGLDILAIEAPRLVGNATGAQNRVVVDLLFDLNVFAVYQRIVLRGNGSAGWYSRELVVVGFNDIVHGIIRRVRNAILLHRPRAIQHEHDVEGLVGIGHLVRRGGERRKGNEEVGGFRLGDGAAVGIELDFARRDGLVRPDAADVRGAVRGNARIHVIFPAVDRHVVRDRGGFIARSAPQTERVLICAGNGAHGVGREVAEVRAIGIDHRRGQSEERERERADDSDCLLRRLKFIPGM